MLVYCIGYDLLYLHIYKEYLSTKGKVGVRTCVCVCVSTYCLSLRPLYESWIEDDGFFSRHGTFPSSRSRPCYWRRQVSIDGEGAVCKGDEPKDDFPEQNHTRLLALGNAK